MTRFGRERHMTTAITNYTTYDLAYYYADLRHLPLLSRDERQRLVTSIAGEASTPASLSNVKCQLIESYLPFAKYLAITLCPPALYRCLLPELIGAVNLAVVEAVVRCDLGRTGNLDAYLAAYVLGTIKQTRAPDNLLPLPTGSRAPPSSLG